MEISVVIPVYGVEQWIERCARSLFAQTKKEGVEFIFVDDNTPDGSIDVLRRVLAEYPERKGQVTILSHPENRGLPQARKTGIEAAHGDYILNVDSDDWLDLSALEILADKAVETHADIIIFDYARSDGKTSTIHTQTVRPRRLLRDMLQSRCHWSSCTKLIKRELYFQPSSIEFPSKYQGEDMFQVCQLVSRAKSIEYVNKALYFYFYNPESARYQSEYDSTLRNAKLMQDNVERLIEIMGNRFTRREIDWLRMRVKIFLRPLVRQNGGLQEYRNMYPDLNFRIMWNTVAPLKSRLRHLFAYFGI